MFIVAPQQNSAHRTGYTCKVLRWYNEINLGLWILT